MAEDALVSKKKMCISIKLEKSKCNYKKYSRKPKPMKLLISKT